MDTEKSPAEIAFEKVLGFAGNQSKLATRLKITPQAVQQWDKVPADRVGEVAEAIGFQMTPEEIRPDLFGRKAGASSVSG